MTWGKFKKKNYFSTLDSIYVAFRLESWGGARERSFYVGRLHCGGGSREKGDRQKGGGAGISSSNCVPMWLSRAHTHTPFLTHTQTHRGVFGCHAQTKTVRVWFQQLRQDDSWETTVDTVTPVYQLCQLVCLCVCVCVPPSDLACLAGSL